MTRRPVCLLCLIFILFLYLSDYMGIFSWRGNPLADTLKIWIKEHPQSTIYGEVERVEDTEFSQSVYLKNAYLIYKSEKFSIKNIKVYIKESLGEEALSLKGSKVLLKGRLEEPGLPRNPGEFDSRQYYAGQNIYYFLKDAKIQKIVKKASFYQRKMSEIKKYIGDILERTGKESGDIFKAMLLGERQDMDEEIKSRYQMAGIMHILAISGLHISMLGMGIYEILKKCGLGIYGAGVVSLVFVVQYAQMTGGNISAMRAVTMFLIAISGKMLGRIYDMLTALSVAAVLLLIECPEYLYSSSFLFSFGAVVGIGCLAPEIQKSFSGKNSIQKTLVSSLAVTGIVLPVNLWFYGETAVLGVLWNIIVLPTAGIVLVSGIFSGLIGCMSLVAGEVAALPGRGILWIYERICELSAKIPFSMWIPGKPDMIQIIIYYGIIFMAYIILRKKAGRIIWKFFAVVLFGMAILILGYTHRGELEITCLDVGQGDGVIVTAENGKSFLSDGGSSNKKNLAKYQLLPYIKMKGIHEIEGILISHTDSDHISGIREMLEQIKEGLTAVRVNYLILPKWENPPEAWKELKLLAQEAGIEVVAMGEGAKIRSGSMEIEILAPLKGSTGNDCNEEGLVFMLQQDGFKGLFMGDVGISTENKLLQKIGDVDFLKVGHHGSKYSTGQSFLEKARPEIAVISCSDSNKYGHPSQEAIERLKKTGCQIEYTMKNGAITIQVDQKEWSVKRFLPF